MQHSSVLTEHQGDKVRTASANVYILKQDLKQSLELLKKKKKKKKKEEISTGVQGHAPLENFESRDGGRNSSVGSAWARCPQRRGFDPPLGTFSVEGIFPLELTWVQTPFPQKLLRMRV